VLFLADGRVVDRLDRPSPAAVLDRITALSDVSARPDQPDQPDQPDLADRSRAALAGERV
jgi:hypothetical protein